MSHNWLPNDALCSDTELCQKALAEYLRSGSLCFVFGSGVSSGMGLPTWKAFVEECVKESGLQEAVPAEPNGDALTRMMEKVESTAGDKARYFEILRSCLYRSCRDDTALLAQPLLSVIGAMTMNSRRGFISEVVTFNFDNILERYLELHGFDSQVIIDLPELRRDVDVTIYHPHGFLHSSGDLRRDSNEIILSSYSFDNRMGDRLNSWQELLRDLLLRKVALFVGLSDNTGTLQTVVTPLASMNVNNQRPTGFWLIGPNDDKDTESRLLTRNIVPIRLKAYDDYPKFLLKVCQYAASR